jgi:predicted transcriptional regulator
MTTAAKKSDLTEVKLKVLYYIHHSGPAFTKKLTARLNENLQTIRSSVEHLQNTGYLERVSNKLVEYRINKRNKVTKHRNHTYYDLSRKGRLFMRHFQETVEVNLTPPYKQV